MKNTVTVSVLIISALLRAFPASSADPIAFGPADSYTVASTPYRMAAKPHRWFNLLTFCAFPVLMFLLETDTE